MLATFSSRQTEKICNSVGNHEKTCKQPTNHAHNLKKSKLVFGLVPLAIYSHGDPTSMCCSIDYALYCIVSIRFA